MVHLGVQQLPADIASKVAAVVGDSLFQPLRSIVLTSYQVLFGDPFQDRPLPNIDASKVDTFCFEDDLICKDTLVVDAYHLAYYVDAVPAAQFVQSKVHV